MENYENGTKTWIFGSFDFVVHESISFIYKLNFITATAY